VLSFYVSWVVPWPTPFVPSRKISFFSQFPLFTIVSCDPAFAIRMAEDTESVLTTGVVTHSVPNRIIGYGAKLYSVIVAMETASVM
jgi:hypothetical protein